VKCFTHRKIKKIIKNLTRGEKVEEQKDYRISFFKPTTPFSKTNRNLVIVLVLIWAIAVFGFQILLRVMEKPTPEKALVTFEKVWGNVKAETASTEEKIEFANSVLMVLGKSSLAWKPEKRAVLDNALSWVVYDLMSGDSLRSTFITEVANIEKQYSELTDLKDVDYLNAKASIIKRVAPMLNLKEYELKAQLLPLELRSAGLEEFKPENKEKIHDIMSLYLTHNRSVLTDTAFLGFPFHYFYTAVFLLVLFVVLCWVYSFKIDSLHRKMGNFDKPSESNN
jgi:putative solute:sodium symporter small subunit